MSTVLKKITNVVSDACRAAYPDMAAVEGVEESISFPDQSFGDVATSIAMRIAAQQSLSPREVAENLRAHLDNDAIIADVSIAGAGFINFRLKPGVLAQMATAAADFSSAVEPSLRTVGAGKTVVMDYSHPNIGKPMGVHHLLSTVIGDGLKRSLRQGGYEVVADNFLGDLGTQFGKLIWAVKQWGDTGKIEADPITELQKLYVKFHIEADTDTALDDAGREEYRRLEAGDAENRALWHKIVAWSKAEIQPIYDALGVEFDHMNGESFYEDKMQPLLDRGIAEGILVESQGALVCHSDNPDEPPAILRKQDGATLYLTRDLARIEYWEKTWSPDVMLVVVDAAQNFSQKQLYAVSRKMHLTDAALVQVNFGRMRFADGGMSTRKGNILLLKDLIEEAQARALVVVKEKSRNMSESEQLDSASKIAISSIKYNILMQNRLSDIVFDWDTMLNFEGNSAPYLLYTIVRLRSLLAKSDEQGIASLEGYDWSLPIEREVALQLSQYPLSFERALREYKSSHLANYAYLLAQKYNNLYNNTQILQADASAKQARLALSRGVEQVLTHILDGLGLTVPDKM